MVIIIPLYLYIIFCIILALLPILHELNIIPSAYLNASNHTEYLLQILCITLTLGNSWGALRLFSTKRISRQITQNYKKQNLWNIVRILMIGLPMIINIECYYATNDNKSFLYCFLITLVAFIFCWPQKTTNH